MQGFKKLVRDGIEVRVGDRLKLDLILEVGQMEETVSVTAESPLLETGSASAGQVIDEKRISLMPLSDGNPFVLSRIVPGIAYTGDLLFSRPFDNGGTSSISGRRRVGRQRVLARRIAQHGQRPPRGVRSAGGGRAGVQSGDRDVRRGRRPFRRRPGQRHAEERHEPVERRELLLSARRQALGDRLLREPLELGETGADATTGSAATSAGRCGCQATTAGTAPSSSAPSSGSTTSSRSPSHRRYRQRRCATATFPLCSPRASPFTIRTRRASRARWSFATRSRATSFRQTASIRSRATS